MLLSLIKRTGFVTKYVCDLMIVQILKETSSQDYLMCMYKAETHYTACRENISRFWWNCFSRFLPLSLDMYFTSWVMTFSARLSYLKIIVPFRGCILNNYWMRLSVISRIIKVDVGVICRSGRLRLITLTEISIILDITKSESNNCFFLYTEWTKMTVMFLLLHWRQATKSARTWHDYLWKSCTAVTHDMIIIRDLEWPWRDYVLLYIKLTVSFLIGRKRTVNFRNPRLWRHNCRLFNNHVKVTSRRNTSAF